MAQLNYVASAPTPGSNTRQVTRSTGALTTGNVAIVIQTTADKNQIQRDIQAALRAIREDMQSVSSPAQLPTSGAVIE